jgi:membrane-associated phospholipid phosphatase
MTTLISGTRWLFITTLLTIVTSAAVTAEALPRRLNAVIAWNAVATEAYLPTQGLEPLPQSRTFAMMHAAIHDALNATHQRYEFYTPGMLVVRDASPDAAVAAAAYGVLIALVPTQQPLIQDAYKSALAEIPDGPAEDKGIVVGKAAAASILARRFDDGVIEASTKPYVPTGLPGDYTFTPPFDVPPLGPLAVLPGWGAVTPFAIDLDDHRVPGPDSITSIAYALDFAYLKAIGEVNSTYRTAEESEIARFWYEDSPIGWNRIARTALLQQKVGLWESARILALANFAMADGYIAGFDAKYYFRFWRPITAIRQAAFDGNRLTAPDANWTSFLVTPPVPDYPSTHTVVGAAAAQVLIHFLGDRLRYSTTSVTEPGVTRHFWGFRDAAVENGWSRVYAGIHFVRAVADGYIQGSSIGHKTARLLRPVR